MISLMFTLIFSLNASAIDDFHFVNSSDGTMVSEMDSPPSHIPNMVWALDPFEKMPGLVAQEEDEEEFQLEGTLASDRKPAAIIDDQVIGLGEEIGSRKLRRVGANYVLLEKGGSVIEIPIKKKDKTVSSPTQSITPAAPVKEPILEIEEIKP
jgi:hypothetical protein